MVKIFTCTPFLSDAGSGVIAEILYYIPGVITRMGLKFNTFATFEYAGAYRVLPVVYSFDKLCGRLRGDAASYPTSWVCKVGGFTYAFIPSVAQARQFPLQGSLKRCNRYASLVKGDSPRCGEMSRSDRGDGHRLGGGFAVGELGGIYALATKQSPGLFLPNADAFGASCLLHCVQFTHRTLQIFNLSASLVKGGGCEFASRRRDYIFIPSATS
jgi:hypothetical protein